MTEDTAAGGDSQQFAGKSLAVIERESGVSVCRARTGVETASVPM